jgi:hypothetical protein
MKDLKKIKMHLETQRIQEGKENYKINTLVAANRWETRN